VLREHRWTVSARHKLLARLKPHWRKLSKLLEQIEGRIVALSERLQLVDRQMTRFEALVAGSGHGLIASVLMRFVISLLFVAVGAAAAVLNFYLLVEPLDGLFAAREIAGFSVATYLAAFVTAATLVAALMIFEGLKVTSLMPMMAAMTRRGRVLVIGAGIFLLAILCLFEASAIAVLPAFDTTAAAMTLTVADWLMFILGLVTPLMLAFIIVPLEYLLHTVRPVIGGLLQIVLHSMAFILRILASLAIELGRLIVQCYDVIIFVPLRLEADWHRRQQLKNDVGEAEAEVAGEKLTADAENVTSLTFGSVNKK
jgi:hypothetical protein